MQRLVLYAVGPSRRVKPEQNPFPCLYEPSDLGKAPASFINVVAVSIPLPLPPPPTCPPKPKTRASLQENLSDNSVVILYDPVQTANGQLTIKAYRLSKAFMRVYREKKNEVIKPSEILEELPIKIRNPGIINALIFDLQVKKQPLLFSAGTLADCPPPSFGLPPVSISCVLVRMTCAAVVGGGEAGAVAGERCALVLFWLMCVRIHWLLWMH